MNKKYGNIKKFYWGFLMLGYIVLSNLDTDVNMNWCFINVMFVGPCIVIYSYSKTNLMHNILNLFYLEQHSTCFGLSLRPSSGV
jgi:hypothetical protein